MRGLVVVGVAALLLFLYFSNVGSAQSSPDLKSPQPPAIITCTQDSGTTVVFKASKDVTNLHIGTYCSHEEVPAGWSVVCRVGKPLDNVVVSYTYKGDERRTKVTCS
jgi:hypothetical protein